MRSKWKTMAELLVKRSNEKLGSSHDPTWCVFGLAKNRKHLMLINKATKMCTVLLMVPLRKKSRPNYDPYRALLQKIVVKRPQETDKTMLNTTLGLMPPFSSVEELELTFIAQGEDLA